MKFYLIPIQICSRSFNSLFQNQDLLILRINLKDTSFHISIVKLGLYFFQNFYWFFLQTCISHEVGENEKYICKSKNPDNLDNLVMPHRQNSPPWFLSSPHRKREFTQSPLSSMLQKISLTPGEKSWKRKLF